VKKSGIKGILLPLKSLQKQSKQATEQQHTFVQTHVHTKMFKSIALLVIFSAVALASSELETRQALPLHSRFG
jgi:uncharacterized membrane protein